MLDIDIMGQTVAGAGGGAGAYAGTTAASRGRTHLPCIQAAASLGGPDPPAAPAVLGGGAGEHEYQHSHVHALPHAHTRAYIPAVQAGGAGGAAGLACGRAAASTPSGARYSGHVLSLTGPAAVAPASKGFSLQNM